MCTDMLVKIKNQYNFTTAHLNNHAQPFVLGFLLHSRAHRDRLKSGDDELIEAEALSPSPIPIPQTIRYMYICSSGRADLGSGAEIAVR
jgi:hypothetical protein